MIYDDDGVTHGDNLGDNDDGVAFWGQCGTLLTSTRRRHSQSASSVAACSGVDLGELRMVNLGGGNFVQSWARNSSV